jgi:membrane protein
MPSLPDWWPDLRSAFEENQLFTYASAIAFRVTFAVVPLALLGLGLLGLLGLGEVWETDVAPRVQEQTSGAGFEVIDQTVRQVLEEKQLFWATLGAAIAIWSVAGAMRTVMLVLGRIYHSNDHRSHFQRTLKSFWLGALVTALVLAAVAAITTLPDLIGGGLLAGALGWVLGLALLFATISAIVRFGPERSRPMRWVTVGTVFVIVGWVVGSLLFSFFVGSVSNPGFFFGGLSVVMISLGYMYLLAVVFVTGLQVDSLIRREVDPEQVEPEGDHPEIIVAKSLASVEH